MRGRRSRSFARGCQPARHLGSGECDADAIPALASAPGTGALSLPRIQDRRQARDSFFAVAPGCGGAGWNEIALAPRGKPRAAQYHLAIATRSE